MAGQEAPPTAPPTRTGAPPVIDHPTARPANNATPHALSPGGTRGPRYGTKRGHTNDSSVATRSDADASHGADKQAQHSAEQSMNPVSTTRFMDLMRSVRVHPGSVDDATTGAEDGSAEALLSLMESVRAKEIQFARDDSLLFTSGSKAVPTAASRAPHQAATAPDNGESSSGERAGDVSSDGSEHAPKRKPYHKKRKSTHTVRKEEKAFLLDEIKSLEDRLTFLRGQVFAPIRDAAGQIVQPGVSNAVLRQAIHEQQLRFASARSLLSQSLTSEIAAPLHTYLRLGSNMAERRAQLLAMQADTLASGKRYIEERSRLLDLTKHHAVVERFETVSGDSCCIRFYVDQFPTSLTSVRNVHEATSFFTSNLEMSITECLGHITIREDDDSGDPSLSQHRLVVAGTQGVVVDTNNVVFSHYNEHENYGILATTYVDEDELHPYRPLERIRQDVTAVSLITQHDGIVIVRRWAYVCMRHSPHVVFPYGALQTIRENLGIWGDGMMRFVRERLRMKMQAQQNHTAATMAVM